MEMIPVTSSNIESIGYDKTSKELNVKFKCNESTYVYKDVPQDKFDDLLAAQSVGKYHNVAIKGVFIFDKVDGSGEEKENN